MKYIILFEKSALHDIQKIKKSGKRIDLQKLEKILNELETEPYTGTGNPEQLKYQLSGFWSRRINKKDRLIYEVIKEPKKQVIILSALGHY
jgi:toxin YoeB